MFCIIFKFTQKALGTVSKFQFVISDLFWTLDITLKYATIVYFMIRKVWKKPLKSILFKRHPQSRAKLDRVTWELAQTCSDGYFVAAQSPAATHHYFQG